MNKHFIFRQLTISYQQSVLFILCVALSVVSLVALRGFGVSISRGLLNNARQLTAGDVIIRSNYALSEPVNELIGKLAERGEVASARIYEFYSLVRTPENDQSLLVNIKVAEPGYPFYGVVDLASARSFDDAVSAGGVAVEQTLLDRMGLAIGDSLRVGEATLVVRDVVLREPDRPVNFFSLGPRMFVSADDLESLDLVKSGSRVSYSTLLKVDRPSEIDNIAKEIASVLETGQESVDTYRTAESNVQRFYDNFLFFLNVVAIFTLLLSGIGIQSALTAFLRERRTTIAIVKTLGATRKFIYYHYYAIVAILGSVGMLAGILTGFALQRLLPTLFGSLLPPDIALAISGQAVVETVLLGVFVVVIFTYFPLYRLEELRPSYVFRKEMVQLYKGWPYYAVIFLIVVLFTGMVVWQLGKITTGLYFVGGILALILIAGLLAEGTLQVLQRQHVGKLDVRQAVRGLFRPGNATRSIVVALLTALGVLFCIFLVEQNLDATFVQSYPEDAPNLFFVDIQPDQLAKFSQTLDIETEYYPVVRASLAGVNGERPLDDQRVRDGRDWQFGLTYRDRLLDDESVVGDGPLFVSDFDGIQVSVLDEVLDFAGVTLGDEITFRIQGVSLDATVTSVRSRMEESAQPFFSFVFPSEALIGAPQTIFTAVRVEPGAIASLQTRMVNQFPNISAIDVTVIATLSALAGRLSWVIRFFSALSIVAGILIVVSSVYATRFARIQEAAYYKVLGANSNFVLRVFTMENLALGLVSGILALVMAQVGSWIINTQVLELEHQMFPVASAVMLLTSMFLIMAVGMIASVSILRRKPITFLREQSEEE